MYHLISLTAIPLPVDPLGNYRLTSLLGGGGFAEVYLGEHIYLKTLFAIKVFYAPITDEDTADFLKEARTIAALDHPHIIQLHDCGVERHIPYLVMKYASGGTLRQRHPKGSRLPPETIVRYVKQVADALQYAHDQKVIHRDVKPENMLLGRAGMLFLSDFGIALIAQTTQTTQDIIGTWAYMAPEQFEGKPRIASDQYSLGIVVYEWICGERPFQGTSPEIYGQHLHVSPPSLKEKGLELPDSVEQVVFKALEKDSKNRFESIQAFADALENAYQPPHKNSLPFVAQNFAIQPSLPQTALNRETLSLKSNPDIAQPPMPALQPRSPSIYKSTSASSQSFELESELNPPKEEALTIRFALEKLHDYLFWFMIQPVEKLFAELTKNA